VYIDRLNLMNSRFDFGHDDNTINIVVVIIIIIIIHISAPGSNFNTNTNTQILYFSTKM